MRPCPDAPLFARNGAPSDATRQQPPALKPVVTPDFQDTKAPLHITLERTLAAIDTPTITLRRLFDLIGEQGLLFLCALLTIPFLLPVSIPGLSSVFGPAIILIAAGITANRLPWLPRRLARKEFDADKLKASLQRGLGLVARIERFIRPRLKALTASGFPARINGVALIFAALLLMAPFGSHTGG